MMELNGVVALVTGGASGIGRETALRLAKSGARVAVLDINASETEKFAKEIGGFALIADVSDESSVIKAFQILEVEWGIPRVCINCAGILTGKRVVENKKSIKLDSFRKTIDINLIGTFNVIQLAANYMTKLPVLSESEERGVIINTASIAAFEGQIGQAAYSASKAGIVGMTLPIARELAAFGIRMVTIAPGLIETPMLLNLSEKIRLNLQKNTVFPRRFGKELEFAKLVLHIIDNILLNGVIIRLDGGVRLPNA